MRQDIIQIIEKAREVSNAIVLTHNIDFLFVQSVVLPAMRKCGSPTLTIFADAHCAEESYQQQAPVLHNLGLRYRVVPVAMKSGFRFHPKAVFLSGLKQATLLVGSGNLTFGGWRENGEVWIRYDTEVDGNGAHSVFRNYLEEILDLIDHSQEPVLREIEEAFDSQSRAWAAELLPDGPLLGRAGRGRSMLEKMQDALGERKSETLYVCAPYYDADAEALQKIAERFQVKQTILLIQDGRSNLQPGAANALGAPFHLKRADFERLDEDKDGQKAATRTAMLHAKFYAFEHESEVVLFAGSANCSRAALLVPGSQGNAELLTSTVFSAEEFNRYILSELKIDDRKPQLTTTTEKPVADENAEYLRIRAATIWAGVLEVHYESSEGMVVHGATVDKVYMRPSEDGPTWIRFRTEQTKPLTIFLNGQMGQKAYRSPLHWIDNEALLSETARSRSLGDSIQRIGQEREWGIGAWSEVLTELYKHLEYMPKHAAFTRQQHRQDGTGTQPNHRFTWEDVFSKDYVFPVQSVFSTLPVGMNHQAGSLKSLLLRWFGIEEGKSLEGGSEQVANRGPETGVADGREDQEEPTDQVEQFAPKALNRLPVPATKGEQKQAQKLVQQVADRLADEKYLIERPPEMLAADLKLTAVLLRVAFSNGWITTEEFFKATMKIWMPLLFDAAQEENAGWLELRQLTDSAPAGFVEAMSSPELSAAFASWALALPAVPATPAHARFNLAAALSVARLPWLWQTGGPDLISKQVAAVLSCVSGGPGLNISQIEARWITLIRRGYALSQLAKSIAGITIPELSGRISQLKVHAGEILWQGRYGFCVADATCTRSNDENCSILKLQYGDARMLIRGSFLVPLAGLLEHGVTEEQKFSPEARQELVEMVREIQEGMKAVHD